MNHDNNSILELNKILEYRLYLIARRVLLFYI